MFTATLRGMVAHKLRLVLTTASIALGVAFLAGTLILTDTMALAFDPAVRQGLRRHRRRRPHRGLLRPVRGRRHQPGTDRGLGPRRRSRPSTASAPPRAASPATRCSPTTTARPILTNGGAPTLGYSMAADETLRGDVDVLTGHAPARRRTRSPSTPPSAEEHHIALGSHIKVLFHGPTREFTVVGTVGFGGEKNLGGTTSAYFDTATAQKVLGHPRLVRRDRRAGRRRRQPRRARQAARRRGAGRHRGGHRGARRQGELRRGRART